MKGIRVVMAAMVLLVMMAQVTMAEETRRVQERYRHEHQWMVQHGMDDSRAEALLSAMEEQGMDAAEVDALFGVMRGAVDDGLPPGPFLRKAEEGVAKRVKAETMMNAMTRVRERYRYAHAWAGELVPDDETASDVMEALADTLAAGMETGDLDRLRDRLRTRDRVRDPELCGETALTLREMTRLRLRSRTAADAVDAALEQGYDTAEMIRFRNMVMAQVGQGNGEGVMNRFTHAIRNGASASELGAYGGNSGSGSGTSSHGGQGASGGSSSGSGRSGGSGNSGGGNGRH